MTFRKREGRRESNRRPQPVLSAQTEKGVRAELFLRRKKHRSLAAQRPIEAQGRGALECSVVVIVQAANCSSSMPLSALSWQARQRPAHGTAAKRRGAMGSSQSMQRP